MSKPGTGKNTGIGVKSASEKRKFKAWASRVTHPKAELYQTNPMAFLGYTKK